VDKSAAYNALQYIYIYIIITYDLHNIICFTTHDEILHYSIRLYYIIRIVIVLLVLIVTHLNVYDIVITSCNVAVTYITFETGLFSDTSKDLLRWTT